MRTLTRGCHDEEAVEGREEEAAEESGMVRREAGEGGEQLVDSAAMEGEPGELRKILILA
jgi:hypothetical protein